MKQLVSIFAVLLLAGCMGQPSLEDEKLSDLDLNLEEFFEGKTVAYGHFQDVFGTVRRLFKVDIEGEWDGKTLTMVEDFVYEDNSTEQRIWTLEKTGDQTWVGQAEDRLLNKAYISRFGLRLGEVVIMFEKIS